MLTGIYLYLFFSIIAVFSLFLIVFNFKTTKHNLNNKLLLKSLLENFDLELPEELKHIDNSSTDPQKLS
tara:strand:+ start:636 stop:842 length:207 start_codon:yes stop_codon:yes gene_type:complete